VPASRDDAKTLVITRASTSLRYPISSVDRSQLGIYDRKFIVGDAQFDSDSYQSAVIYSDLSGGIGIEDSDEGADTTRFWFGVMDTRSPRMIGLPPLVSTPTPPQAGACRPLGVIGTQFYACFDDDAYGWNDTTGAWHATVNDLDFAPVNKPVAFDGRVWIPQGANGIRSVTETTAASGALTEANITATPEAAALCIWNNKLYALATDGDLWVLPQGTTTWATVAPSSGTQLRLNTSETPKNLASYFNRAGEPTLWAITDRAAYQFYETAVEWRPSNIAFPPHPDFGRSVAVWRTGEDLWIAAGLDIVRQTTGNAIVPLASGVSRDQGVPQEYRGTTLDICPEISSLYALVGSGSEATDYDFDDTVGSLGTGDGEFTNVRGLSVDSAGSVFACDTDNERVQEFNSTLTYAAKFGASGTGDGQFAANNGAYDCAHDSGDALFVVDKGNSRIQKWSAANAYVSTFGTLDDGTPAVAYSETWGLTNSYLTTGSGDTNLNTPAQCATDSSGNVYIADTANNRLKKVDSSGAFVAHVTLTAIAGIAVDASWVYAAADAGATTLIGRYTHDLVFSAAFVPGLSGDCTHMAQDATYLFATNASGNTIHRILKTGFDTNTFSATTLGSAGSGNGQFSTPYGIAYHSGELYIVDQGNSRVQVLNTSGTYQRQFSIPASCRGCAVNSNSQVLVANFTNDLVNRYTSTGTLLDTFAQADPDGVATTSDYTTWVTDATSDTLNEWDLAITSAVPSAPPANGTFNLPESIAIKSSSGRIYVADTGNHRVEYFTSAGAYEGQFGSSAYSASTGVITAGSGDGEMSSPSGVAVNQTTGDVYVLDTGNDRVQQFTATGTYIRQWGTTGTGNGQFTDPTAIGVSPATGNVFVTDSTRDDVQEFSGSGAFIRRFGGNGTGNGQFAFPSGIAFNAAGTSIYVSDLSNEDVQEFVESISIGLTAAPTLHAWPGTGWHCLWAGATSDIAPTWMVVSAPTTHYRLWWGDTDGNAYYLKLFRGFENPNQARLAGSADFAASGYWLSSKFDAGMLGFRKAASHVTIIPIEDSISSAETLTVDFAIDDGGWENLGVVNATTLDDNNAVTLSFGAQGRAFQSIRFRVTGARGSTVTLSPFMRSLTLFFDKIPQAARSFVFTLNSNHNEGGAFGNRTGHDFWDEIDDLSDADEFFDISFNGKTYEHCRFAGATGTMDLVGTGSTLTLSVIHLPQGAAA
jgi:tripartite motif-containing protein 71